MKHPITIWLLALVFFTLPLKAQYSVTALPPPPQFTFNDLWRVSLLRTAADQNDAFYLSLRIFGANNLLKVKSNTALFSLPPGATVFDLSGLSALQPFTTSYYDAGLLQQAVSSGGAFPPGNYTFSYTLFGKTADGAFQPLAEENAQAAVEALWPPMLLSPPDGDTVDTPRPLLTWTPAFASYYNGPVDYTLRLVELLPGQNAFQAVASNPVYFSQAGIPVTTLPYPAAAQTLDTGKVYAWQVHASGAGSPMGGSEIWTFRLATPEPAADIHKPRYYIRPARQVPAEYVQLSEAFLPVALDERYQPAEPTKPFAFNILDENHQTVGSEKDFDAPIHAGFNRYLVPVCSSLGKISLPKGKYHIEILLEKKTKYYIAFQIKETRCHD